MVAVQLPSGATFPVHIDEVDYFQERVKQYLSQNHFVNVSDLQDVDRLLILETMLHRWNIWLSSQRDYWGSVIDANETQKQIKEWSVEARQLKKSLGMDKLTRDKQKGDDSVAAFIANLLHRGREFGINRERQLDKALELFQQMSALVTLHDNTDEIEQREQHVTTDDVMEWLREIAIPEYRAIDDYFRTHVQSAWIRDQ
jgi:hypothetical protein